jgi:CheY-like chemotaxis protein
VSSGFSYRILVVDDDESIRITSARVLESKGFEVRTANDGFQALIELRKAEPNVIISDLRMPNMNGFELLSVVRRRFPHIPVIAISGEYNGIMPEGLIADHFFSKGGYTPDDLFVRIADLLERSPLRPSITKPDRAPVWIPRNAEGYFVITCTDCLRSFSVPVGETGQEVHSTKCLFCGVEVMFLADLTKSEAQPELLLPRLSNS